MGLLVVVESMLSVVLVGGHMAADLHGSAVQVVRAVVGAYVGNVLLTTAAAAGGALLVCTASAALSGRTGVRGIVEDVELVRRRLRSLLGLVAIEALLRLAIVEATHPLGGSSAAYLAKGAGRIVWFLLAYLALEAVILDGRSARGAIADSVRFVIGGRRRARREIRDLRRGGVLGATGWLATAGLVVGAIGLAIGVLGPDAVGIPVALAGVALLVVETTIGTALGALIGVATYRALKDGAPVMSHLEPWLRRRSGM